MKTAISYLMDIDKDEAVSVFLFPEGTDLSKSNIVKSNQCTIIPLNNKIEIISSLYSCKGA